MSFAQSGLYAPGNLNNFFDCKILTKSERFSEIVFLVKCIRGTYIRAGCKNQRLFEQYK